MSKTLTPEQRKAKTEREKARRARLRAAKGPTPAKAPKPSKPKKEKGAKTPKASGDGAAAAPVKRGKEVDVAKLKPGEVVKMLSSTHKLQKRVETAEAACERAKRDHREAKAKLEKARVALKKEIDDQRFGPGELYGPGAETMHVKGAPDEDEDDQDGEGDELAESA